MTDTTGILLLLTVQKLAVLSNNPTGIPLSLLQEWTRDTLQNESFLGNQGFSSPRTAVNALSNECLLDEVEFTTTPRPNIGVKRVHLNHQQQPSLPDDRGSLITRSHKKVNLEGTAAAALSTTTATPRSRSSSAGSWTGDEVFYRSQASKSTRSRPKSQNFRSLVARKKHKSCDLSITEQQVPRMTKDPIIMAYIEDWLEKLESGHHPDIEEDDIKFLLNPMVEVERGTMRRRVREWSRRERNQCINDDDIWVASPPAV